ncbi:MAG: hypothetical protein IJX63_04615 [Lachnospiraceae bacterium]|nr:hypothetical protein [Lachnospiraceae bacterium]
MRGLRNWSSCSLKELCDEVEGRKELHRRKNRQGKLKILLFKIGKS